METSGENSGCLSPRGISIFLVCFVKSRVRGIGDEMYFRLRRRRNPACFNFDLMSTLLHVYACVFCIKNYNADRTLEHFRFPFLHTCLQRTYHLEITCARMSKIVKTSTVSEVHLHFKSIGLEQVSDAFKGELNMVFEHLAFRIAI